MSDRGRPGLDRQVAAALDLVANAGKARVICLGLSALDQIWRVPAFFSGGGAEDQEF